MNVIKDSYMLNSKVAFLKSDQNAAGNCPFFLRWIGVTKCMWVDFEKLSMQFYRLDSYTFVEVVG